MNKIHFCTSCNLCSNQKPLLDNGNNADVVWVGLSAKKVENTLDEIPLANNTNSGKIIENIEKGFESISFYKTNIVKCLPLDDKKKLRYPTLNEMSVCLDNFNTELKHLTPNIVFLLGKKVSDFMLKEHKKQDVVIKKINEGWVLNNTFFIPIYHPSYVHVYKRKEIDNYVNEVKALIERFTI